MSLPSEQVCHLLTVRRPLQPGCFVNSPFVASKLTVNEEMASARCAGCKGLAKLSKVSEVHVHSRLAEATNWSNNLKIVFCIFFP